MTPTIVTTAYTKAATANLQSAIRGWDKAQGAVQRRMTEFFVAHLAADAGATAKTVSKLYGAAVPSSKESGTGATVRSHNTSFFTETPHLAAVRAALPNVGAMPPEDFQKAVETYAATLKVREWIEARAAKRKAQAAADTAALTAAMRDAEPDENVESKGDGVLNPEYDPVLDNQTQAAKAIAALLDNASPEAGAALDTLLAMLTAGVDARNATDLKTGTQG